MIALVAIGLIAAAFAIGYVIGWRHEPPPDYVEKPVNRRAVLGGDWNANGRKQQVITISPRKGEPLPSVARMKWDPFFDPSKE